MVKYVFPGTKFTTETLPLTWYNGDLRPPAEVKALIGSHKLNDQGSIFIGTEGVLYSPYIAAPVLCRKKSSRTSSCRIRDTRTTISNSSKRFAAMARPQRRSTIRDR